MAKGGQTPEQPGSPEVRAAWARKEAGDVAGARREAERLLAGSPTPEDRAEAEELLRRTSTPKALFGFALLAAAVFVVLLLLALTRYA
ncbi:molecular chaperone DnaJ [Myxococcus sp. CA051A]|uniref:molecular chaperone DnaJ n=1 Tax=unclassified Myxococcus TaxID=2648731 RepID=UPI00157B8D49|nr:MULTISPECIES: molecular chaperone DnaJ [unclassified Myxococcus]NTX00467.1 molecular chaperone DnaJ [Myxococcus sp. CA040A]NTX17846.1 molecular chaperone DnaJ [Myxococcus sp. CA056]NTX33845.1 molecular chaperone DnaJ [Myxococcus sp. CA033]NTX55504.1 molecular chaperone DnaJ [Myxococcus sp. CA039A]NTX59048.1 molecular chaperone DnaJ [Myxococcus sp. CA051A]